MQLRQVEICKQFVHLNSERITLKFILINFQILKEKQICIAEHKMAHFISFLCFAVLLVAIGIAAVIGQRISLFYIDLLQYLFY